MTKDQDIFRGAYVLHHEASGLDLVLIAAGPDVGLALQAASVLEADGIHARVVAMPSTQTFDQQTADYQASVLPPGVLRIAVDTWVSDLWLKYVGPEALVVGVQRKITSESLGHLWERFETTLDFVIAAAREHLACPLVEQR